MTSNVLRSRSPERRADQIAAQLQRRSDADSLAAAGLFAFVKNRSQALVLLQRASDAAPERADLVWVGALTRAAKAHDEAAQDVALTAIGHMERVDIYWTVLGVDFYDVTKLDARLE